MLIQLLSPLGDVSATPDVGGLPGSNFAGATGERRRGVGAGDRADRGVRRRRAMGDRVARPQPALRGPRADGGGDLRRVGARDRSGPGIVNFFEHLGTTAR